MVVDVSERQRAQVELAARNREVEALARVSEQALTAADPRSALAAALDEIRRATGFPVAILERWDTERDTLILDQVRGLDEENLPMGSDAPLDSPSRVVVAGGAPRSFADPRDFVHRIHPALRDPEPRLLLVFPLESSDGPLGALTLLHTEPARPDGRLVRLGAGLAASLAVHMERLDAQNRLAARERSARELAEALRQANRELEGFAHTVAHDLRAPLRTMQGFSHALSQHHGTQLPEQARDFLRRIIASGEQAEELISDLLAYSRMSFESMELQEVDLNEVVREALEQLQGDVRRTGAQVEVEAPLPRVRGHHRTLVQVTANLVSNGIKFVPDERTPELRIHAAATDGNVRLTVTDNGIGIPEDKQERIFRVFERLADQVHREGTGIGLAIVRRGLERLGGQAGVDSREGQGSSFWVEVPALPG
jgi:signal transduction histidine kinase